MSNPGSGIIVGGGIVGLTLALALHKAGIAVQLVETAPEIKALGVGLNLLPHSVKHLIALGLERDLEENAVKTQQLSFYCKAGKRIWTEPRGLEAGYQIAQYSIHRGTLQQILLHHVISRLGEAAVRTNRKLVAFDQNDDQVSAYLVDDAGKRSNIQGDFLIGADGINSSVRQQLYPAQGEPHFANLMLWRGATLRQPFLGGQTMIMAGHNQQKIVAYPITPVDQNGQQLINWVAELSVPANTLRQEDWNGKGCLDEFADQFEAWNYAWLETDQLFRDAETIFKFPMIDRDPVDQWSFNRVTLAGDAAHAMYPNGSNGASQGIVDAICLAKWLTASENAVAALRAYEKERLPATSRLVLENRKTGPERVLQMVEDQCRGTCGEMHQCVPGAELEEVSQAYKKLAGFDKKTVNQ